MDIFHNESIPFLNWICSLSESEMNLTGMYLKKKKERKP